jgi:hypothetical protein
MTASWFRNPIGIAVAAIARARAADEHVAIVPETKQA